MELVEKLLKGEHRAAAKLITFAENNFIEAQETLKKIYSNTGNATVIGITGPPGAGKSTLVDKLVKKIRSKNKTVGVISIDPTSPFTGGALLGDRIRLQDLFLDEGVFIRSMGTRGSLGGLSRATTAAINIIDALGKDYIFVETVGVGQSEVDIVQTADAVVLTMVPGLGDDIQAIKAGVLEIGDVFAVNKADKDGADRLVVEIDMMLDLNKDKEYRPPVVKTIASKNEGIDDLWQRVEDYIDDLKASGKIVERRCKNAKKEIMNLAREKWEQMIFEKTNVALRDDIAKKVALREQDPYTAVEKISDLILSNGGV